MNWYNLILKQSSDEMTAGAWKLAWEVAGSTKALDCSNAIFQKAGPGKSEMTLYFTPSAATLAITFGANRCNKPAAQGLTLVAGDERAWSIHFDGKQGVPVVERLFRSPRPAFPERTKPDIQFEPTQPAGPYEPTYPAPLR